jgi:hypothetical protein
MTTSLSSFPPLPLPLQGFHGRRFKKDLCFIEEIGVVYDITTKDVVGSAVRIDFHRVSPYFYSGKNIPYRPSTHVTPEQAKKAITLYRLQCSNDIITENPFVVENNNDPYFFSSKSRCCYIHESGSRVGQRCTNPIQIGSDICRRHSLKRDRLSASEKIVTQNLHSVSVV